MTIFRPEDPLRWVAADDGDACGAEHYWSGWTCQAVSDHDGPHRYYLDGVHATWTQPQGVVVVNRGER